MPDPQPRCARSRTCAAACGMSGGIRVVSGPLLFGYHFQWCPVSPVSFCSGRGRLLSGLTQIDRFLSEGLSVP